MPMPYSTTIRMTVIEESACRSNASLANAMRPVATCEMMPTTMIGMNAMIGLRKMMNSRPRISRIVTMPTIASAFDAASWESRPCAAEPVTPMRRPVPSSSGFASSRRSRTLSMSSSPNGLASLARLMIDV